MHSEAIRASLQLNMLSKLGKIGRKEQPSDLAKYAAQVEQVVENFRRLSSDLQKGVQNYILYEKRNKKLPEAQLSALLKESLDKVVVEGSLFQMALQELSEISSSLATVRHDFETQVEKSVLDPLSRAAETTHYAVTKQRRNLNKATSDLRSAKDQLSRVQLQSNITVNNGSSNTLNSISPGDSVSPVSVVDPPASAVSRLSQLQSQLNEKEQEARLCKDNLLRDLYTFAAQEDGYAMLLVDYLRIEESFHQQSLQLLRQSIPSLVSLINKQKPLTTFCRHLPNHLAETGRTISYVLETCISRLDNPAVLQEQGLFRRSGPHRKTELLVKALNLMQAGDDLLDGCESTVIASALKQYLNSLPEPLITYALAEQWAVASKKPGASTLAVIEKCLETMPLEFRRNLAYVCLFLAKITSFSEVNKMTSENLSIVMAPNLYRLLDTVTNDFPGLAVSERSPAVAIERSLDFLNNSGPGIRLIDLLIKNAETLFADDIIFLPSPSGVQNVQSSGHSRSASNVSLTDSKPPKPPEPPRFSGDPAICISSDRTDFTSADDSNRFKETSSLPDGVLKRHGLPPPLLRKKSVAPKPPIQQPPTSLSIPVPNPSRLPSVYEPVVSETHDEVSVSAEVKPPQNNPFDDPVPDIMDPDRSVVQPKDDRPKRPLPPSTYHCK